MESLDSREVRWSVRKPLNLDVDLYFKGYEYTGCRTRDIGLGGLFVEFKRADIPQDAEVQIVIRLFKDGNKKIHKFRTTVAHASERGYGLAFQDFDIVSFRMLQDILQLKSPNRVTH